MKSSLLLFGSTLTLTLAMVAGEKGADLINTSSLQAERDLRGRAIGKRKPKSGKGNDDAPKSGKSNGDVNDDADDDAVHHRDSKSGKSSKKKGPNAPDASSKSKSGKSSKDDHMLYYAAPFNCANKCLDAAGADFATGQLTTAVQYCSTVEGVPESHDATQKWMLHMEDDMIQVESYAYKGRCIGVDYMPGDQAGQIHSMCHNGVLALLPCEDPATSWYFTGGQLLSFFCWSKGVSAKMSVTSKDGVCHDELRSSTNLSSEGALFMFIEGNEMPEMIPTPKDVPTLSPSYSPTSTPVGTPVTPDEPTGSPTYYPTESPTTSSPPTAEPTISNQPTVVPPTEV